MLKRETEITALRLSYAVRAWSAGWFLNDRAARFVTSDGWDEIEEKDRRTLILCTLAKPPFKHSTSALLLYKIDLMLVVQLVSRIESLP